MKDTKDYWKKETNPSIKIRKIEAKAKKKMAVPSASPEVASDLLRDQTSYFILKTICFTFFLAGFTVCTLMVVTLLLISVYF